jgi:hypothetical protein
MRKIAEGAAWSHKYPSRGNKSIRGFLVLCTSKVDECSVGEERVQMQLGAFYGGRGVSNLDLLARKLQVSNPTTSEVT